MQGGSPQFFNTYKFFEQFGSSPSSDSNSKSEFASTNIDMQISFGKGPAQFWTNVFPSELVSTHRANIRKFGRVLKVIKALEPLFAVVSVQAMLRIFGFPTVSCVGVWIVLVY